MSKIPYVIQQDSPNLVIVPTESCYEPSPKKTKLDNTSSSTNVPECVQNSAKSALVKNAGVKVKPRVSSVNQNVLIDVSKVKRQPNSWATNFLQSIGGSASKLPRAYNWHSSASKLAFPRNENIQPLNNLPIAHPEMYKNTTQPNTNKEAIQLKSIKEPTTAKNNSNASQPEPSNDFSLSNGTNATKKSKTPCFNPKPNTEANQAIDNKARLLPTVEKESSHLNSFKEATQTKTRKEASQHKSTKEVTDLKAKRELSHLIAPKKITRTKETLQKKIRKEGTKLRGNSETCRAKIHNKDSEPKNHKEKFKSKSVKHTTTEKKPSKTQTAAVIRENIELKKKKVEGKKSRSREKSESGSDKNTTSKEVNSKKIKRASSKARNSTSPLRSVVNKIKNYTLDDPKHSIEYELDHNSHNLEKKTKDCNVDLRAKLKRKASKNDIFTKEECKSRDKKKHDGIFPTIRNGKGFVPDDNLIISFDTENDTEVVEKKTPVKTKTRKHQSGGNKCKKIKLEINIVFQKDYTSDEESPERGDKDDYENNNDLSFLDDFNVDEIAEILNDCQSNIVNLDNLIDLNENKPTTNMDVDVPITNDKNAVIRNYGSISKGEIIIENNNTNVFGLTLSNEKSLIKTEKKVIEILEVQRLTDHNGVAKNNNNDNSELKIKNILESQRKFGSATGKTNKLSNAVGGVKTELISNDANDIKENIICVESFKDLSVTNSNNIEKLSEPERQVLAEPKLKNDYILTSADKMHEEVNNSTSSAQLHTINTNSLPKKNTETDKTTNIDNKHVENLAAERNVTLPNDIKNGGLTKRDNNSKTSINSIKVKTAEPSTFVDNSKHENDVIVIEDSDNDCYMAEVQETKCVVEQKIIDLTFQNGCSLDKCKKVITVDSEKPKIVENSSEPILILDTDYDELKANAESNNKEIITNSNKCSEPIDIIKKHLFCNSDKIHATDKILKKADIRPSLNQKINIETKKNQDKNTRQNKSGDVKIKNDAEKNITPSVKDNKEAASNKASYNITPVSTKKCVKAGQDQAQTDTRNHKKLNGDEKSVIVGDQIPFAKENHDSKIRMWEPTTHNTVTQIQAKTNTQDQKGGKLNTDVKSATAEKLNSPTNENDDINITMWLENRISQDMKNRYGKQNDKEKSASIGNKISNVRDNNDNKIRMWVVNKGDTRTKAVEQNQPKSNTQDTKDGKPKSVDNMNTQNVNAKCQPKVPNKTTAQAASVVNKNVSSNEKADKTNMLVKGDPRTKQNQSKANSQDTKDGKPKTVDNMNTQNVNATCQPNVPNKTTAQAASVVNRNASATEKKEDKTNMLVKGDPRTKQNQSKENSQDTKDGKPKTVDNMNTQDVNAKCQPKVPNKTAAQAASVVNKNASANEKEDKTNMLVKGDPRTKQDQSKSNSQDTKDGKPKTVDNMNTQNVNAKCQPEVQNKTTAQAASVVNKNASATEKKEDKTNMLVKGDPRTKQNQSKENSQDTKDGKPKTVDNMNTQNVNAKCQPKVPNKTTAQAASVVNKNASATEKEDKTNMLVKGDPRTKQNQSKSNSQDTKDGKPKTVNNINSQKKNDKCQPNVPNKSNSQGKGLTLELTRKHLIQIDQLARRLECRMRVYFAAKYCVTDLIHSGGYSTIYHCKDGNGESKTVKQIKGAWQIGATKEAMLLKLQFGVPESNYAIVTHFHGFTMGGLWCYMMEYYPKNLQEVMNINNRSFHIDKVQEFSRQLVAAVTILRNNNIIHSDINPMHILVNESETRLKLCGFDQAFYYNGSDMLPNVGTANYRAPELILGFHADYSIDVWATALVMYEMATNRQLFPGNFNNDILYKQFCTLVSFPYEMLERCYYRDQHFMGDAFVRIVGSRGEGKVLIRNFFKKERIHSVLSQVYLVEWAKFGANRAEDKNKLYALGKLLKKMLVMDPRSRITIEFVFADPFIYEML